jgi:hypothetical protein
MFFQTNAALTRRPWRVAVERQVGSSFTSALLEKEKVAADYYHKA